MEEPAAFELTGALGANGIMRCEIARVLTFFQIDIVADQRPRKIEHLEDLVSHSWPRSDAQSRRLVTFDAFVSLTFMGVYQMFRYSQVSKPREAHSDSIVKPAD